MIGPGNIDCKEAEERHERGGESVEDARQRGGDWYVLLVVNTVMLLLIFDVGYCSELFFALRRSPFLF